MKLRVAKILILIFLLGASVGVSATIKCDEGKPGDTVNCAISNKSISGSTKRISADTGLSFVSCDVCKDDGTYIIENGVIANFKFKIASDIKESKTLNVSVAGEDGTIKVNVENSEEESNGDEETPEEVSYTVTLVIGNNQANKTKSCKVNSLNSTCNITLDELEDVNFNGWGTEKGCTEGSKGNIKVNKDITYYACYKNVETNPSDNKPENDETNTNNDLLLKSLVVKNGEDEIDLGFSIRIKEYDITVPTSTESLEVLAESQNEDVEVTITGHEKLENEDNQIIITLTDKDGKTNQFKINVKKTDDVVAPLLNNLAIPGYAINFSEDVFVYNVTIDKGIKELNIEYTKANEDNNVEIVGNSNLKNGSQIRVIVSDNESAKNTTYLINVHQESSNLIIYISIGAILLVILVVLLIIIVKKGKKNNGNTNNGGASKQKQIKGKSVNSKNNIPDVTPAIPTPPVSPVSPDVKKNEIEVLDF